MAGRSRLAILVLAVLLGVLAIRPVPAQADAERNAQWHLAFLDMGRVHQVSQGAGVTVAVIDSGINGNHPDLAGNVLQGISMLPGHPSNGWESTDTHGTAMAGLIAAHGHNGGGDGVLGIAPQTKVFPIQVGSGGDHGTPDIDAAGIDAAVRQGARVISMSIGDAISLALSDAVVRAQQADVVIVAAAGNKPDDIVTWPAHYDGVVAVAAVDRNGNHADISVTGRQVLVAAPGVDIESASTGNLYLTGTGTSASTAIVAGVVALIRSKFPTMSATEVIHRLTATATDKGPKGRDEEYGYGIVNPYAALTADIPPLATSASPSPPASPPPSGLAQNKPSTKKQGSIAAIILAAIVVPTIALALIIGLTRRKAASRRRTSG